MSLWSQYTFILNVAPQIGFDPIEYFLDEDTGTATLYIVTNAPGRFVDATGALFYTMDGTAVSSGGMIMRVIRKLCLECSEMCITF